jgi:hypothetical protein
MNPFKELNSTYRTLENGLGSLVTIAREAEHGELAERAEVTLAKAKEQFHTAGGDRFRGNVEEYSRLSELRCYKMYFIAQCLQP